MNREKDQERFVFHLAPCPFCGSMEMAQQTEASLFRGKFITYIYCNNCKAAGPKTHDKREAYEAWNKRSKE